MKQLHCGDFVREREGRHIGRVVAILHMAFVRVRWEGSGWLSDIPLADVEVCDTKSTEQ